MKIDVVIPAHKKDLDTLEHCIKSIKKNVAGVDRIIVVSREKYTDLAEFFDEGGYPFSYHDISELAMGNVGWNFQQLLKLYAPLVIPKISKNVLIVDSDTVFYNPVSFFEDDLPLYNLSKDKNVMQTPFHKAVLEHIKKLLPEIFEKLPEDFFNTSGICHHMLFQKERIEDLFKKVEETDGSGDPFYKIFIKNQENQTGVSEYNLYFYFLACYYSDSYKIRKLKYKNCAKFNPLFEKLRKKYDYCSYHSYMREDASKNLISRIFNKIT